MQIIVRMLVLLRLEIRSLRSNLQCWCVHLPISCQLHWLHCEARCMLHANKCVKTAQRNISRRACHIAQCTHGCCSLLRFMVAEVEVGRPWGTGDWPPELILRASRGGLLEVAPAPAAARGRAVLPIALAERVELPMNALPVAMPYSPSPSPSKSSALSACCTHLKSITMLRHTLLCTLGQHHNIATHLAGM